jgi:hypothetical protein
MNMDQAGESLLVKGLKKKRRTAILNGSTPEQ